MTVEGRERKQHVGTKHKKNQNCRLPTCRQARLKTSKINGISIQIPSKSYSNPLTSQAVGCQPAGKQGFKPAFSLAFQSNSLAYWKLMFIYVQLNSIYYSLLFCPEEGGGNN